jgi:hypothetical protein
MVVACLMLMVTASGFNTNWSKLLPTVHGQLTLYGDGWAILQLCYYVIMQRDCIYILVKRCHNNDRLQASGMGLHACEHLV